MTYDMERVLADIDADHGDCGAEFLRHGVLLVLRAPRQFLMPAGIEPGRTIPLAETDDSLRQATPTRARLKNLVLRAQSRCDALDQPLPLGAASPPEEVDHAGDRQV